MAVEVKIAGNDFEFVLRVHSYEFAAAEEIDDANWLNCDAELTAGSTGTYRAHQRVTVRTVELLQLRDELRQLLRSWSGKARLDHIEEQVGCTVDFEAGRRDVTVFVREHFGPELRVTGDDVDEAGLTRLLSDLDDALNAFPVRLGES